MNYNINECGKRVRELRKQMGMTQEEFADRLGVSVIMIGSIERGSRCVSLDMAIKIAQLTDTSLDYLLSGETPQLENVKSKLQQLINDLIEIEKGL